MNKKLKQIGIPFILMLVFNLGIYYLSNGENFGAGLSPHVGILFISGLLFGPYGALGSVIGNLLCDLIRGYSISIAILSAVLGFGVSYLGYKLWYESFNHRFEINKPKLNSTGNVIWFIGIIIICGVLYSLLHGKLFYLLYPSTISINSLIEIRYFLNFINASFIFGIVGIWISKRIDFVYVPTDSEAESRSKKSENLYKILGILLVVSTIFCIIIDYSVDLNTNIIIAELLVITVILFSYLRKPTNARLIESNEKSISEDIMNIFHITIIFIIIIGIIISYDPLLINAVDDFLPLNRTEIVISMMVLIDILLVIFIIPSLAVLRHVESKVIEPILSFSKIESFIHENERIEADGLIEIYSKYIDEENEIGTLARSYTDLIKFNNSYIENIREIEGEKERIKAELDIAKRIQAANLPTKAIETDEFKVNGYSHPAKEVGGDFFDYYMIDEDNLAIIIGDASGKGVPAAILAMISQVMIKQTLKHSKDPSNVLNILNNQLCENNSESMFITLFLGIYNKTERTLTFSNAGHNPPLIKENEIFNYLKIDTGLVLGIMEDFEFAREKISLEKDDNEDSAFLKEIVLYTDGITDANNKNNEMYGEDRLKQFFNDFKEDSDPIRPLLKDIGDFTKEEEQFDDMTLLYLKIK